jgi:hypothetical protein
VDAGNGASATHKQPMKFTNKFNLPGPMFRALSYNGYRPGESGGMPYLSVTQLISPPRKVILRERHSDKITEDVSDRIWSLLGQSVHSILEAAEDESSISEERLYMDIDGYRIGGMTDLYETSGVLSDFKVTSVWSVIMGSHDEWEQQLNLNAGLYRHAGFEVNKVQIIAILRDWQQSKAEVDPNYPQCGVQVIERPLWTQEQVIEFARERIKLFKEAAGKPDHLLPLCSPEERWRRGDSYAVKKAGNKKATKVFDTEEEAKACAFALTKEANGKTTYEVEFRPGQDLRCLRYCEVAQFCSYGRNLQQKIEEIE